MKRSSGPNSKTPLNDLEEELEEGLFRNALQIISLYIATPY